MERVQSLIHMLQSQLAAEVSPLALLPTVEALHSELLTMRNVPVTSPAIAVWLPGGFSSNHPNEAPHSAQYIDNQPPLFLQENKKLAQTSSVLPETTFHPVASNFQEHPKEGGFPNQHIAVTEAFQISHPSIPINESIQEEKPLVFELDVTTNETIEAGKTLQDPLEGFLGKQFTAGNDQPPKPLELHQKLVESRIAMAGMAQASLSKEWSDTYVPPKIADLKKGITIGERYQFISSLFRGDESMYERSLKTLNNFNILAEAEYWMQRELMVKLGWHDEDPLAQQFRQLVKRRFS